MKHIVAAVDDSIKAPVIESIKPDESTGKVTIRIKLIADFDNVRSFTTAVEILAEVWGVRLTREDRQTDDGMDGGGIPKTADIGPPKGPPKGPIILSEHAELPESKDDEYLLAGAGFEERDEVDAWRQEEGH